MTETLKVLALIIYFTCYDKVNAILQDKNHWKISFEFFLHD